MNTSSSEMTTCHCDEFKTCSS